MFQINNKKIRVVCVPIIFAVIFATTGMTTLISAPKIAEAQDATGVMNVPIGTGTDFNNIMAHLKDFVLDRLATLMAKQLLHQMTVSVVNWINSGFEGSPAFLTNPQAFFLDAADQVTGEFLASEGLNSLCSPFSLNIRLSLALNQTTLSSQRYRCTLGKIVENANGTINGFVKGDFSQGGWPAFISLTTEPQNNPYGAFLYAQSDLNARISARHNAISADLQLGKGFMSWQDCKDVTERVESEFYDSPNVTMKVDERTGRATFKECTVSTPGSVIAGTLQKNLDVPVVELELANSINAVVDALVSQMLNQMLSGGLRGLSSGTAGGVSFTNNLQAEQTRIYQEEIGQAQLQASASLGQSLGSVQEYRNTYGQAITAANVAKTRFQTARACFVTKLTPPAVGQMDTLSSMQRSTGQSMISSLDSYVAINVDPLISTLTAKQAEANMFVSRINSVQDLNSAHLYSSNDIQGQSIAYQGAIQSASEINLEVQAKLQQAQRDVADSTAKINTLNSVASQYQSACDSFPYSTNNWQRNFNLNP